MSKRDDKQTPEGKLERNQAIAEIETETLEAAVGAAAGAITGALAGPIGLAVGASIGAAAGVALGHQLRRGGRERAQHDRDLDDGAVDDPFADDMPGRDSLALNAELDASQSSDGPRADPSRPE